MLVKNILMKMSTDKHKKFLEKLIPNIDEKTILGVKNPELRILAKKLAKENPNLVEDFLKDLPHQYLEENILHAFLICNIKNFDKLIFYLDHFKEQIDNWAVCDSFRSNTFKKKPDDLMIKISEWIVSDHVYTKRLAMGLLLSYFLGDNFKTEHLDLVSNNNGEDYYLKMMVAWYFSMALAKQYDASISHIEGKVLDKWTHNKAIQKAIESRQISQEKKDYLRSLKIK